jgi:RNA 3'-terminal phosphate cyclase (ATP)
LSGDALGSTRLTLRPQEVRAGTYRFDVGTAGSAALVLQAILLPLALADGPSRITITGGTHVPWSPPAEYLGAVLFPVLSRMGIHARLLEVRAGLYPRGGGVLDVEIMGRAELVPLTAVRPDGPFRLRGAVMVARLPRQRGERLAKAARERLERQGWEAAVTVNEAPAKDAGIAIFLAAEGEGIAAGFSGLGGADESPEALADRVVAECLEFARSGCGCDSRLADQVVLPMALAPGTSRLTTPRLTAHVLSGLEVARQILACPIQVNGSEGQPGAVTIQGGVPQATPRNTPAVQAEGGEEDEEVRPTFATVLSAERRAPSVELTTSDLGPRVSDRSTPIIRKALAKDGPAIQAILAQFAPRGLLLPRTLNEVYKNLRDFCVAEVDGAVVGVCGLSLYWEDLAEVRSLAVLETQGSRGLGSALVSACVAEAAALGIRRVFALTYRQTFFERLGFHVIQKEELPQKIWKDCIRCSKFTCCDEIALIRETRSLMADG